MSITDGHISMDELFDFSSNQRQQTPVGKLFSDRNPLRVMRSLLKEFQKMLSLCTKTLSMVVEFHSITVIVFVVNNADRRCFPRDWPMKVSWP